MESREGLTGVGRALDEIRSKTDDVVIRIGM